MIQLAEEDRRLWVPKSEKIITAIAVFGLLVIIVCLIILVFVEYP